MWIPKPVYEVFPYAFLLGGVAAISSTFNVSGVSQLLILVCGMTLILSSVIVLKMRRDARRWARRRAALKARLRYGSPPVFSPWGIKTKNR